MSASMTSQRVVMALGLVFLMFIVIIFAVLPSLTGGFRRPTLPGSTLRDPDRIPQGAASQVPPERTTRRSPVLMADRGEAYVPKTRAEKAWFASLERLDRRKERLDEGRELHEARKRFMESGKGKTMVAVMELARRGLWDKAKEHLGELVENLAEETVEVQQAVLKRAIAVYSRSSDRKGLSDFLLKYLRLARHHLQEGRLQGRAERGRQESLEKLANLIYQVEQVHRKAQ